MAIIDTTDNRDITDSEARREAHSREGLFLGARPILHIPISLSIKAPTSLMEDYDRQRADYVGRIMRWVDIPRDGRDRDGYDSPNSGTHFLIAQRTIAGCERAFVGVRVTPVNHLDDCLSLRMWDIARQDAGSEIARQFDDPATSKLLGEMSEDISKLDGVRLYDTTRLIPLMSVESLPREELAQTHRSIVRLIGGIAGLVGLDSMHIFTASPQFLRTLMRVGFSRKMILVRGQIGRDRREGDSALFLTYMMQLWRELKEAKPDQAALFEQGYRAICGESPDDTDVISTRIG
jgi:hypothetical protein